CVFLASAQPADSPQPPLITAMQQELSRSMDALSTANPPAYFISYTVTDADESEVSGSNGALIESDDNHNRYLEVQTRVGSYQLDDTHKITGGRDDLPAAQSLPCSMTIFPFSAAKCGGRRIGSTAR